MNVWLNSDMYSCVYLWVHVMKAPPCKVEGIESGTHYAPEHFRLQLNTVKGSQSIIHNMSLQNMIQLSCDPSRA